MERGPDHGRGSSGKVVVKVFAREHLKRVKVGGRTMPVTFSTAFLRSYTYIIKIPACEHTSGNVHLPMYASISIAQFMARECPVD